MQDIEIFFRLLLSLALGALVGAERERFAKRHDDFVFGGIRTFMFISLLGALSAFLSQELFPGLVLPVFMGLMVLLAIGYYTSVILSKGKGIGVTGEIAALLIFLIGMLTMSTHILLAVALAILITSFLYLKERLHGFLKKVSEKEVYSTLIFAIIAFVVLPFLPNQAYGPLEVLNPYKIWLMVVFICGMGYVGYILIKIFGSRQGIGITGLLGGLVSSTAVTLSMSERSKKETNISVVQILVLATILANIVMFIRVLIEVYFVNPNLLVKVVGPIAVMILVAGVSALVLWLRRDKHIKDGHADVDHKSPLRLLPALKFGLLFAVVLLVIKAAQLYLGQTGIYAASIITGFVDVDAITLSMANIAGVSLSADIAATAIVLAVLSNTLIKFGYAALFGSKEFKKRLGVVFSLVFLSGLIALLLF